MKALAFRTARQSAYARELLLMRTLLASPQDNVVEYWSRSSNGTCVADVLSTWLSAVCSIDAGPNSSVHVLPSNQLAAVVNSFDGVQIKCDVASAW